MRRIHWSHLLLAALLAFGLVFVPSGRSLAQDGVEADPPTVENVVTDVTPTAEDMVGMVPLTAEDVVELIPPNAKDEEIALIESNGMLRIVDPYPLPGIPEVTWTSGDTGWGYVAAGDFNGDGDAELVAIKGGTIRAFDPVQQPGWPLVTFQHVLSGSRSYQLLATGDLDNDGRDEIVATHTESSGVTLQVWRGNFDGTAWGLVRSEPFGSAWDAVSVGDMNNDSRDDIALVRRADQRIKVYRDSSTSVLVERSGFAGRWLALALGNISNSYPGNEMALTRTDVPVPGFPNLILYRLSTSGLSNLVDLAPYSFSPPFSSISLGDANGDGDAEVLLLRNPLSNKTALKLVNPTGASMRNFERTLEYPLVWNQVRTGDLDADGRAEVVVLRSDRYRIYWQIELDDYGQDFFRPLRTPPTTAYDRPTMAIADFDNRWPLLVSPTSINAVRLAGSPTTVRTISIARPTAATNWTAWLDPAVPGVTLSANSGTTPSTLNVNITLDTLGSYPNLTRIRIQADPSVPNYDQYIPLNLWVTDKAVYLPLIMK